MPGLYIHVPFCQKKCFYCDFYSIESLNLFAPYLNALLGEMDLWSLGDGRRETGDGRRERTNTLKLGRENGKRITENGKRIINTVFLGGGTPSLFSQAQLEKVISKLHEYFNFSEDAEWTLEANPATFDVDSLKKFKDLGINRLSIGIQSFNENELKFLERIHSVTQAQDAVKAARGAGFDNVSIDLMFAIPGQTIDSWNNTISKAIELEPDHISSYSLIYEPGTPLYKLHIAGGVEKTDDEIDADMYEILGERLSNAGYEQYEVSNYARNGKKCFHNLNYWDTGEYFAFGPSAHGYLNGERYWNVKSLDLYVRQIKEGKLPIGGREMLSEKDKINEYVMLGLRAEGIPFDEFQKRFNIDIKKTAGDLFEEWQKQGYCIIENHHIKLTHKGYFLCNSLSLSLLRTIEEIYLK